MKSTPTDKQRRSFLFGLGLAAAGSAAAMTLKPGAAGQPVQQETVTPAQDKGYRLSEHVRNYYRTAKI